MSNRWNQDLSKLVVGQQIAVTNWRYSTIKGYKVKRITPTGYVIVSAMRPGQYKDGVPATFVEHQLKFNKHNQCLTEFYKDYSIRADLDVIAEEERAEKVRKDASAAISAASSVGRDVRHTWGKESLLQTIQKMESELAKARAWLEQI